MCAQVVRKLVRFERTVALLSFTENDSPQGRCSKECFIVNVGKDNQSEYVNTWSLCERGEANEDAVLPGEIWRDII